MDRKERAGVKIVMWRRMELAGNGHAEITARLRPVKKWRITAYGKKDHNAYDAWFF